MSYSFIAALVCLASAPPEAEEKKSAIVAIVPPEASTAVEDERFLIDEAKRLMERGALEAALVSLDAYATQFSTDGQLRHEALRLDVDVMTRLGRHESALEELDRVKLSVPEHADLVVVRGELRAGSRRTREALADFDRVLSADKLERIVHERALSGKAFALLQSGRVSDAHETLRAYLERYPEGRFASLAQRTLRPRPATANARLPDPIPSVQ